ncbi:MAG TPA: Gfo/Idh/MocA family oxidoreductase [Gemmataceae bacterium]|jgi:predicted dehydrogenase|nr:Gfo/Idh/MocA family oxidoreductase [Gemmataceae bacterium]
MRSISRRDFLTDSAALAALAGAGLLGAPAAAAEDKRAKKGDANDKLHVAVVGVHGRGKDHVHGFAGRHNCVVAAICDADEAVIGPAMKAAEKAQGTAPRYEQDIRKLLDDKTIDIVTIAMPNHWHSLAAIWAMQAGKDVYVEKPVSHNVREGRRVVEAARKYNRICQTGTQSRSTAGMREAMDFLRAGKLGKVKVARGLCYKSRPSIGRTTKDQTPPKTVDYDLWIGPAPMKALHRQHLHYDWHWFWDYGNGDLGNQGIHQMDICRWGLGKDELAKAVISFGGRFGYKDDGETANTQVCVFDYGDSELIFEVRGLPTGPLHRTRVGNIFHCEDGYLVCSAEDYGNAAVFTPDWKKTQTFHKGGDHFGNFVEAVRSRSPQFLNADIHEGHLSSALCHLGNISYRLGTLQPFNKKSRAFGDDKEAYETFARVQEHLKDNAVPLESTDYRLGRRLTLDPKTETFVGDKDAEALLTRKYRKGFVVPEKV